MLNITSYQRNTNQNYNEVSPHSGQQKNLQTMNAEEDVEKRESSCIVCVCVCGFFFSICSLYFIFSYFLGCATWHVESQFPDQGSNPCPLRWKPRVLTAGVPGKSPSCVVDAKVMQPLWRWQFLYGNSLKNQNKTTI